MLLLTFLISFLLTFSSSRSASSFNSAKAFFESCLFSSKEQKNAKLNICTEQELAEFRNLNENYEKKFGFPFIISVKGKNKSDILKNFRIRIKNNINEEFEEAKSQVVNIASFRLDEILDEKFF